MAEATARNLEDLPLEIFLLIIDKLPKRDLGALSLASKKWHPVVKQAFWHSLYIKSWSEHRLHRIQVPRPSKATARLIRQVHFYSGFEKPSCDRCPHNANTGWATEPGLDYGSNDHFGTLARDAGAVLGLLEDDQLESLSWDLGACIPLEIFGDEGILRRHGKSLKELSLTTLPQCRNPIEGSEADLAAFTQLRTFRWRAPTSCHTDALAQAVHSNAGQLESLELDFINWNAFRAGMGFEDYEDEDGRDCIARDVFGLVAEMRQPAFQVLHTLSLTQVALVPELSRAFNVTALKSLILRSCSDWSWFLEEITERSIFMDLKRFELQYINWMEVDEECTAVQDFLDSLPGLKELYLCAPLEGATFELGKHLGRHSATLKRLVYHQRDLSTMQTSFRQPGHDIPELSWDTDDPGQNPLEGLDLEFIGLCCTPKPLKSILRPFTTRSSLKVIHIRQSHGDVSDHNFPSFAISPRRPERLQSYPMHENSFHRTSDSNDDPDLIDRDNVDMVMEDAGVYNPRLQPEFRRLAEWAFGAQGIPSLKYLVYGDFAHDARRYRKVVLARALHGPANVRVVGWKEAEETVFAEYGDALGACPMEPLIFAPVSTPWDDA